MSNIYSNIIPRNILPHDAGMCLIDKVISVDDDQAIAQLTVRESNIFYNDQIQGIYNWFAIEFMAQGVGIYAGCNEKDNDPEVGLLLSVRKFNSNLEYFSLNQTLTITAIKSFLENKVGVFNCSIHINNDIVCSARLNTYLPTKEQITDILTGKLKL